MIPETLVGRSFDHGPCEASLEPIGFLDPQPGGARTTQLPSNRVPPNQGHKTPSRGSLGSLWGCLALGIGQQSQIEIYASRSRGLSRALIRFVLPPSTELSLSPKFSLGRVASLSGCLLTSIHIVIHIYVYKHDYIYGLSCRPDDLT